MLKTSELKKQVQSAHAFEEFTRRNVENMNETDSIL